MSSLNRPPQRLDKRTRILSEFRRFQTGLGAKGDHLEFMVQILKQALSKASTMEVTIEVAMEVKRLIRIMSGDMKRIEMRNALSLKNDDHFRLAYLLPALSEGVIEMTQPDSPKSPTQRYRLTAKGRSI